MAKFPQVRISFGADTKPLKKGVGKAQGMIAGLTASISAGFANAAAAVGRFAFTLAADGVKAALEDAKAQKILAKQLKATTKATDAQVASVEEWVTETSLAYGVVDDELRPALSRLVRATKNTGQAQKLLKTAMNVSAGTGKDLNTVVQALARAAEGSTTGLGRLGTGLDKSQLKAMSFEKIVAQLDKTFNGFAEGAANTTEGKLARLNIRWDETKEQIGEAVLPAVEKLADFLNSPEGQKAVESFAEDFGDAATALAENMPKITEEVGKLVEKAGSMDWEKYLELGKWAAAFRVGSKVPGPAQVKFMAAIAAYLGMDSLFTGDKNTGPFGSVPLEESRKLGTFGPWLSMVPGYGLLPRGKEMGPKVPYAPGGDVYNMIITGNLDPNAAAKAIERYLERSGRTGAGAKWQGRGTG